MVMGNAFKQLRESR